MRKSNYFKKLFLTYITIIVVYTLIASGVYLFKNNQLVKKELVYKDEQFLQQSSEKIDTKLQVGLNWISQLKLNEHVLDFSTQTENDYYTITKVNQDLKKMTSIFSNYGYKVGITKVDSDLVITPEKTVSKSRYLQEIQAEITVEELNTLLSDSNKHTINYIHEFAQQEQAVVSDYTTFLKKETFFDGEELVFLVSYHDDVFLPQMDLEEKEGFGIITSDRIISFKTNVGNEELNELFTDDVLALLTEQKTANGEYQTLKKGKYMIYSQKSDTFRDWHYISIAKLPGLYTFNNIMLVSVPIFSLLALIGIIIAFFITNKTYRPIKEISNIFEGFDKERTGDELSFIEKNIMNIQHTNENLEALIQKDSLLKQNVFLRNLLFGLVPQDHIEKNIEKYQLPFLQGSLRVVILEFLNYLDLEEKYSKEGYYLIVSDVLNILKETLMDEKTGEIFELNYKSYAIILNDEDLIRLKRKLNKFIGESEMKYGINFVAAIGSEVSSSEKVSDSYNDAVKILDGRFALDKKAIIMIDDFATMNQSHYYYPIDLERDLIVNVIQGKMDVSLNIVKKILDENLYERNLDNVVLSQLLYSIVGTVNRILQQLNKQDHEFGMQKQSLYKDLVTYENLDDLANKITHLFEQIIHYINKENEQFDSTLADEMIAYIHSNYHLDISLTDMADHFNLSSGYISKLFKEYTGENFKDYLNICRVNKAKEIMESNHKIKVIQLSEMVGCNHVNTFIRIFKRYEGVSPGKYLTKTQ